MFGYPDVVIITSEWLNGSVAQSVEQWIEAPCVGGSIPSRAIKYISLYCGYSLVVKPQPSKLLSRVRFSLPALYGPIAQLV